VSVALTVAVVLLSLETVKVSPPLTVSDVLPSLNVQLVLIATLDAPVIRPLLSTVNCGILVASPYVPAVTAVFAKVVVNVTSPEPSKDTLPVASPASPMSRAVAKLPAVPLTLPVTSPVTSPVKSPSKLEALTFSEPKSHSLPTDV
jgi:hypothetical protein